MSKELILQELNKENTDWLLVSKMANDIHKKSLDTNPLMFRKGIVNIIKTSEYNGSDIINELKSCFDSDEYEYVSVGYFGITVTKFNKLLNSLPVNDKYVIIVTEKPQVLATVSTKGLQHNYYQATIRNRWAKDKTKTFTIKGDDIDFTSEFGNMKSEVRELSLKSLGL